jgi:hypothetical protein
MTLKVLAFDKRGKIVAYEIVNPKLVMPKEVKSNDNKK